MVWVWVFGLGVALLVLSCLVLLKLSGLRFRSTSGLAPAWCCALAVGSKVINLTYSKRNEQRAAETTELQSSSTLTLTLTLTLIA